MQLLQPQSVGKRLKHDIDGAADIGEPKTLLKHISAAIQMRWATQRLDCRVFSTHLMLLPVTCLCLSMACAHLLHPSNTDTPCSP
jgi:hypothetical protein